MHVGADIDFVVLVIRLNNENKDKKNLLVNKCYFESNGSGFISNSDAFWVIIFVTFPQTVVTISTTCDDVSILKRESKMFCRK